MEETPKDRTTIGCRWTYRLKRDGEGNIVKYKARLVAKRYSQIPGVDFFKAFTPVVQLDTFRLLLAIAAVRDVPNRQR